MPHIRASACSFEYTTCNDGVQVRELRKISQKSDRLRGKPSRQLIGKKQLGLLEEAAGSPAKWLVVAETTNLHDIFLDYAAAPALVECARL